MKIRDLLYPGQDIYRHAPLDSLDLQGWNSQDPVFESVIKELDPKLIIEVGSWKGASALHMASLCSENSEIVCVDTWLGALEMWTDTQDTERYLSLQLRNGYPQVYSIFLSNVIRLGCENLITPFPQTSLIAYWWFSLKDVRPDLIYIDASHQYEDVIRDIENYWSLLKYGGILFGDDFFHWPGVNQAVKEFSVKLKVEPQITETGFFVFRKD